jgi:hypothetical protein
MDEKIDEKIEIVLNLIRTNNSADEVLKITQAFVNITNGRNLLRQQGTTTRKQGTGAT